MSDLQHPLLVHRQIQPQPQSPPKMQWKFAVTRISHCSEKLEGQAAIPHDETPEMLESAERTPVRSETAKLPHYLKVPLLCLKDLLCKRCCHKHILKCCLLSCRPFWLNFKGVKLHSHVNRHSPEDFPTYIVQSDTSQVLSLVLVLAHLVVTAQDCTETTAQQKKWTA